MNRNPGFLHWLVWAVLVDWLVGRTLTRSAIFVPKSPLVILIYQGLGVLGQLAATASGLLLLAALSWLAWRHLRASGGVGLPVVLASLAILSLVFLVVPPTGWLAVGYHLILALAVVMLGWQVFHKRPILKKKIAGGLVALALLTSGLYQLIPAFYAALRLSGPPLYIGTLFNLGELLVMFSAFALWWGYGRPTSWRVWLLAAIPALGFTAMRLANPAMTGVIAIWSVGLTLYLPWPVYALALWLAGATVIESLVQGKPAGWAILLLAAGGFAPQLSTHAFLGFVALWLLLPSEEIPVQQSLQSQNYIEMSREFETHLMKPVDEARIMEGT